MFKLTDNRRAFIRCLFQRGPYFSLAHASFCALVDLLVALLDEAAREEDHPSVARIFHISRMYGMTNKESGIVVALAIRYHEAFMSPRFWIQTTCAAVAMDIIRWSRFTEDQPPLIDIPKEQLFTFFGVNRIHAMVTSMQYLRIPLDTFVLYLSEMTDLYGLTDAGIDITITPSQELISWLLQIKLAFIGKVKRAAFATSKLTEFRAYCPEGGIFDEIGYSPIQEILMFLAELAFKSAQPTTAEKKGIGLKFSERDGFKVAQFVAAEAPDKWAAHASRSCVCGRTVGQWKALGAYLDNEPYCDFPTLTCETCVRQILANPLKSDGIHALVGYVVIPFVLTTDAPTSFEHLFFSESDGHMVYRFEHVAKTGWMSIEGASSFLSSQDHKIKSSASKPKRVVRLVAPCYASLLLASVILCRGLFESVLGFLGVDVRRRFSGFFQRPASS